MGVKLNPYLDFNGKAREAMEYYQKIFGGDLELTTFGEFPQMPVDESNKDKIMHAVLETDEFTIMASDGRPGTPLLIGDNVHLSFSGSDEAKLRGYFDALSADGKLIMPLVAQSWGDTFGMTDDKYGLHWMVNISKS